MKFGKTVRLSFMLCLTTVFFLLEIIVGYRTNSMALVADSFHMLSDVVALVIALFAVRIAKKESDKSTFGWARAEVLGALVNSVFLCALCFTIIVESIQRFTKYEEVQNPMLVLIVGGVGLAFNIVGLFLFHDHHGHGHNHGHSHGHGHNHSHGKHEHYDHGHKHDHPHHEVKVNVGTSPSLEVSAVTNDSTDISQGGNSDTAIISKKPIVKKKKVLSASQMNMRGIFLHVAGDAIGSLIVIIAASIIWKTDWPKRHYVDPAMSLVSVGIMLFMTIPLLRSTALILLQTVPLHMKARDVKSRLEKIEGVQAVHELHLWQLAGTRYIASAHVWCRNYQEYQRAANRIKEFFHNEGIHSTTIQPEFVDLGNDYHESVNSNPSFCMLTCPDSEDKACQESLCCPPPKTTSNLDATLRQRLVPKAEDAGTQLRASSPVHFHSRDCDHGGISMSHRHIPRDLASVDTEGPSVIVSPSLPQDVIEILEAERDNFAYENNEGTKR